MSGQAARNRVARLRAAGDGVTACKRPGCTAEGLPTYCSRRCSSIDLWRRLPDNHFERMGMIGGKSRRDGGRKRITSSELSLMAAGRYVEAARAIYDRGYSAGWTAGKQRQRRTPVRAA
jgi:hypothetical protein